MSVVVMCVSDQAQTVTEPEPAYLQDSGTSASRNSGRPLIGRGRSILGPGVPGPRTFRNALEMPRLADVKLRGRRTRLRHPVAGRRVVVPSPLSSGFEEGIVAE